MKIESLSISNFRGISEVSLHDLGNMVIIAGQNGSGKSCIFDAIRLLKSVYGGYQANEWQHWMGEFQINVSNRSSDFRSMFNDQTREIRIACDFRLSAAEREFITANADELLREWIWRTLLPEAYAYGALRMAMFAAQFRDQEPEVTRRAAEAHPELMRELASPLLRAECSIPVGGNLHIGNSVALSVLFSSYRPQDIGVIDYHGAQRHYSREVVQGVNLNLDTTEQKHSQSALYNYTNKYANVKSEMAASYVKEILAEKAGLPIEEQSTLTNTLKALFETFFPDKVFLGPQPTRAGGMTFSVKTSSQSLHDLDELSAGEKEILYGYLRIRNSAPCHSIILLDEPELHLNPRLIRGLPQFYRRHLGEALGNQIWLVTHSDALLREVVGQDSYHVFHMLPCAETGSSGGQLRRLSARYELDAVLVDLVGDLAAYHPRGKVVIFEGGGDSDFDQKMTAALFPELQRCANLVSGSNKVRVRALHDTLARASSLNQLPFRFFSIADRDSSRIETGASVGIFTWDVYHIENYFLHADFIIGALDVIGVGGPGNAEAVWDELRACALDTLPQLIRHELAVYANTEMVEAINTGTDPKGSDLAGLLDAAVERSMDRLRSVRSGPLSRDALIAEESRIRQGYEQSLASGRWVKDFRGRDILKRFAGKWATSVPYEAFRNTILYLMKDAAHRPVGMSEVVQKITGAASPV